MQRCLDGSCLCGAVTWRADGPLLWAALCHCASCRRAASADYVSWFGVPRAGVFWEGPRALYASSPGVSRGFCQTCGSPLSYETESYPDETHLIAATLSAPERYRPTAHIFWAERLPWVTAADDLPKFAHSLPAEMSQPTPRASEGETPP